MARKPKTAQPPAQPPDKFASIIQLMPTAPGMIPVDFDLPGYAWPIRIVGIGLAIVDQILFNPNNWKIHPKSQQTLLKSVLESVGLVGVIMINVRRSDLWGPQDRFVETLVDGHSRVTLAARTGLPYLPALYVDLGPIEELEILRIYDPIAGLAISDDDKKAELDAKLLDEGSLLSDMIESESGGKLTGRRTRHYTCPECGYEWER